MCDGRSRGAHGICTPSPVWTQSPEGASVVLSSILVGKGGRRATVFGSIQLTPLVAMLHLRLGPRREHLFVGRTS